jgi:hypothetical protein
MNAQEVKVLSDYHSNLIRAGQTKFEVLLDGLLKQAGISGVYELEVPNSILASFSSTTVVLQIAASLGFIIDRQDDKIILKW